MRSRDKLAAARLLACERMPYFRAAILGMVPKETPGFSTFGVTKHGVLIWDPNCVDAWTTEQTAAVLVHEVSHLLRDHAGRCERMAADHTIWNVAADLEINDNIRNANLKLPMGVYPDHFGFDDNLLAEEYYAKLTNQPKDEGGSGNPGEGPPEKGVGAGKCGGCAGNPNEGEDAHAGKSGRSQVELERIKRQVAEDIRTESQKGRGNIPGGWVRWADERLQPAKVPWRQKLSHAVRAAVAYRPGCVDYHYTRPSRRQAGVGFGPGKPIMPALRAPVPRVTVVVDTSGSMGSDELTDAMAETNGVLQATGSTATFCACDADVHAMKPVRNWKEVVPLLQGGGGTDFRPAFDAIALQRPKPDVVVFITDGCGPAPLVPPPYKVVWVLVGPYKQRPVGVDGTRHGEVAYGEFIEIEHEDT